MYGIIDLGSNSIRLAVYKIDEDGKAVQLLNKKNMAELASYIQDGQMTPDGVAKACGILAEYKFLLEHFGITEFYAFGTAALRNISNSDMVVEEISQRSGIAVNVLSGEREGELDFIGATTSMKVDTGLLIDIGGASTEIVMYRDGLIEKNFSMPLGSLNTYNKYVKHLIPSRQERKAIKQAVLAELKRHIVEVEPQYRRICGVGGSIRAACKLNNYLFQLPVNTTDINAQNVKKIIKLLENDEEDNLLSSETLNILLKVVPGRVRTVLPGMIILETLIKYFACENVAVSRCGIREGYLYEYVLKKHGDAAAEAAKPEESVGEDGHSE